MRAIQKSARTYKINMRAPIKMQRNYIFNVRTCENMVQKSPGLPAHLNTT